LVGKGGEKRVGTDCWPHLLASASLPLCFLPTWKAF
jgi:hypothetical protein